MFEKLRDYLNKKIDRGSVAAQSYDLLQSEAFAIAVESVQERLLGELVSSAPEDSGKRERLYAQYRAVEDIMFELNRLYTDQLSQPTSSELSQGEQNGQ